MSKPGGLLLLVLALAAGGCGGGGGGGAANPSPSEEATGASPAAPSDAAAAEVPTYTVTATEPEAGKYAFEFPSDIKGGAMQIVLQNEGKEPHDLQLAKAVDGYTVEELAEQAAAENEPLAEWVKAAGGVGNTAPGQSNQVALELEPGDYWYFCTVSSEGAGEQPGVGHGTNGMAGEFTVGEDSGATLAEPTATIDATEYTFESAGFTAGENTVRVSNNGAQLHHALVFPLAEGATFEEAKAYLASEEEPQGPPPVDFEGGVGSAVIDPGEFVDITLDLEAGSYALICFMPDRGTAGPPHIAKGMITELKVE